MLINVVRDFGSDKIVTSITCGKIVAPLTVLMLCYEPSVRVRNLRRTPVQDGSNLAEVALTPKARQCRTTEGLEFAYSWVNL